jgi:transcriptional regulator
MYIPPHFSETDLSHLDWLAEHDPFGTLISTVDGAPFASHLPVHYRREGRQVTLTGHWAKPNPQWQPIEGQRVLFIIHGPHAYVSPRWYAQPQRNVPTWNYAAAHLYGRIRIFHEPDQLERIVTALADQFEKDAEAPWRMADSNGSENLRGIVGFEILADTIEIKFKLNQNHKAENITGVISALSAQNSDDSRTIAGLMQQNLRKRSDG